MGGETVDKPASVDQPDVLLFEWKSSISASDLFRATVAEQMNHRGLLATILKHCSQTANPRHPIPMTSESLPREESPSEKSRPKSSATRPSQRALSTLATSVPSHAARISVVFAPMMLYTTPAAAQSDLGSVWCGTGVDTMITIIIGALAGLVLPATILFMARAGFSYERAGGNPEKKNEAKNQLVMSAMGFCIVVLAILSPAIINNIGSQLGFGFADCMFPF